MLKLISLKISVLMFLFFLSFSTLYAAAGCCSHHGGVSLGCNAASNHQSCKDGSIFSYLPAQVAKSEKQKTKPATKSTSSKAATTTTTSSTAPAAAATTTSSPSTKVVVQDTVVLPNVTRRADITCARMGRCHPLANASASFEKAFCKCRKAFLCLTLFANDQMPYD